MSKTIWISIITGLLVFTAVVFYFEYKNDDTAEDISTEPQVEEIIKETKEEHKLIPFLRAAQGVDLENVILINNPVGFKGDAIATSEDIEYAMNYYLGQMNNLERINNTNIEIKDESIVLTANYNITEKISTPIEIEVIPSITPENDLQLEIVNVKLLKLKIPTKLLDIVIDKFVADLFTDIADIEFNGVNITVNKSNFEGVTLNSMNIDPDEVKVNVTIDMEEILN